MDDRLVVDASVAAKWFLRDETEADTSVAEDLLRGCIAGQRELHMPALFTYEVCSFLSRACHLRPARLTEEEATACARDLFALPIEIHAASEEEQIAAIQMSMKFSKTLYDITYLHLAERLDCKLCTADERAAASTHPDFPADRIVLLSELQQP